MPGDLFLATGSFQKVLAPKMLKYSEACNVDLVLGKYPVACKEAMEVFQSQMYEDYNEESGRSA